MSEFISGIFNRHKNEQPTAGEGESIDTSTPAHAETLATAEVATETNPYVAEPVIEPFTEPGAETVTEPTAEVLAVDPLSDPEHLVTDGEETPAADVAELAAEEAEVGSGIVGEITEPEAVQTIDEAPLEGVDAEAPVADNSDEGEVTAVDEAPVDADDIAAPDVETTDAVADELVADDADLAEEVAEEVAVERAPEEIVVATDTAEVTEVDAEDALAPADAIESVEAEPAVVEPEGEVAAEEVAVEDVLVAPESAEVADVEVDAESTEPTIEDMVGETADAPEDVVEEVLAETEESTPDTTEEALMASETEEASEAEAAAAVATVEVEEIEPVAEPAVAAEVDAVDTVPVADDLSEDVAEVPAQGFAPEPVAEPETTADSTVTGVLRVARESRGKSTVSEGLVERLVHHIVAKVDGVHAIDDEGTVVDIVDGVANITVSYVIVFGTQVKGNAVAIRTQVIEAVEDYFDIDVVAVDVNVSDFYVG